MNVCVIWGVKGVYGLFVLAVIRQHVVVRPGPSLLSNNVRHVCKTLV